MIYTSCIPHPMYVPPSPNKMIYQTNLMTSKHICHPSQNTMKPLPSNSPTPHYNTSLAQCCMSSQHNYSPCMHIPKQHMPQDPQFYDNPKYTIHYSYIHHPNSKPTPISMGYLIPIQYYYMSPHHILHCISQA